MSLKPPANPNASTNTTGLDVPQGWYDVKDYGAVGDDSTSDTAAIQAALDAAKAANGIVYFPPGTYRCSGLILSSAFGVTLMGGNPGVQGQKPILKHASSGTTPLLEIRSCSGITMRGLVFEASHASFTGDMVAYTVSAADNIYHRVEQCVFRTSGGAARSAVSAKRVIISQFSDCLFFGGTTSGGLLAGDDTYFIANRIEGCAFNGPNIPIVGKTCEAIGIKNCTFEATSDGKAKAFDGSGGTTWNLEFTGNWLGDTTVAGGSVVKLGVLFGGLIAGNRIAAGAGAAATGAFVEFTDTTEGLVITGNRYESGTADVFIKNAGHAGQGISIIGNWSTNTSDIQDKPSDPFVFLGNNGITLDGGGQANRSNALVVNGNPNSPPTVGASQDRLVVGYTSAANGIDSFTVPFLGSTAFGGDVALHPAAGATGRLSGGSTTQTGKVIWNQTGVAFNGQTPAARPDYTVTNHTDDRALNESADTTAQVANVLGTLINDLIAIGLLQ